MCEINVEQKIKRQKNQEKNVKGEKNIFPKNFFQIWT